MPPAPQLQQELSEGKGGREEESKKLKKLLSLPESNSLKRKEGNARRRKKLQKAVVRISALRPPALAAAEWCRGASSFG